MEKKMKKRTFAAISCFVFLMLISNLSAANEIEPWVSLFDGSSLKGWTQKGGLAKYSIEDNAIVGKTVLDTPNSFLCTEQNYSDFILELEFKDQTLNSGIQIRSNSFPEYRKGVVHGYQIEIDPSERAWTGGIYEEQARGWLYPLEEPEAKKAFKAGLWNKLRVEAIGDEIKTWVNDIPVAYLIDDMTQDGFIALQVHSIKEDKEKEGLTVSWRNVRIITDNPQKYKKITTIKAKNMNNQLASIEQRDGWKLLFDGKTSTGWRGANITNFPENGWEIKDGILTIIDSGGKEGGIGGDIVTIDKYSDFELRVDFKLTPGANSGIKYFVDTELNKGKGSAIGLEYQLLDDDIHPDAKLGNHEGSRTLASLYDLIKPENKYPRNIGQWNHAYIFSKGDHVEHWLNGRKVLEYERKSDEFRKLVAESKYKVWPGFGELSQGQILLQDHGNTAHFKNIKIRQLNNK